MFSWPPLAWQRGESWPEKISQGSFECYGFLKKIRLLSAFSDATRFSDPLSVHSKQDIRHYGFYLFPPIFNTLEQLLFLTRVESLPTFASFSRIVRQAIYFMENIDSLQPPFSQLTSHLDLGLLEPSSENIGRFQVWDTWLWKETAGVQSLL